MVSISRKYLKDTLNYCATPLDTKTSEVYQSRNMNNATLLSIHFAHNDRLLL